MATDWGGLAGVAIGLLSGQMETLFGKSWEEDAKAKEKALGAPPKMEMPQSQIDFEQMAARKTKQAMPGMQSLEDNIDQVASQSTSQSARAATGQFSAMGGGNRAQSNRRSQLRRMSAVQEGYADQAQMGAAQAVKSRAPYETMQYERNEFIPWQIQKNRIAAERGFGMNQIVHGFDQAGAYGIYGAQAMSNNQSPYAGSQPQPQPMGGGSQSWMNAANMATSYNMNNMPQTNYQPYQPYQPPQWQIPRY